RSGFLGAPENGMEPEIFWRDRESGTWSSGTCRPRPTSGGTRMTKCMSTPRAQRIWTIFALVTVGTTVLALLAANQSNAGFPGFCALNAECGCSMENADCNTLPEPGFCNLASNTCVCNSGFGGLFCCPGNGCSGNGNCVAGGICQCSQGFTGPDCS